VIAFLVRVPAAPNQTRSGSPVVHERIVRTVNTCGLLMSSPVRAVSAATPDAVTGAGVSSVASTSASRKPLLSASSNPAATSAASRRARQRETNPVETSAPSSADIMSAARSTPITSWDARNVAAATTFGP
jgi:hypothetical protein